VKSGFAIAVVLTGSRDAPQAIARHSVALSDPKAAETRQPYHNGFFKTEENAREIARRVRIVKRCSQRSIAALVAELRGQEASAGGQPSSAQLRSAKASAERQPRAALVVGSLIDPERVGNPHIRAHAHEGRLFRTVLEDALQSHHVTYDLFLERELRARAVGDLKRPAAAIARTLTAFGKALGGPWRADEKAAATAAWLALGR
jgi:hypothetical protein